MSESTKVALIGPNGCGKTTLLKTIIGEIPSLSGQLILEGETVGYLPQRFSFPDHLTVGELINLLVNQENQLWQVEKILSQLGLIDFDPSQQIASLSEGQKMKFKLVEILVNEPTFLLLDEPTNHLDIEGILWFEKFVQNFPGPILMIAHDRSFLDNTVSQIFEIDEQTLHVFHGNYTDYQRQKKGWVEKRNKEYRAQEQKRKRLEEMIKNASKIKDGKSRGRAMKAARTRLKREVLQSEKSAYQEYEIKGINLHGSTHTGKLMLSVESLCKKYGNNTVFRNIDFQIRGNEHLWLFGKNGAGKSTLLDIITQRLKPTTGKVRFGENVSWAYFRQNQWHLPMEITVAEYLEQEAGLCLHAAYKFLSRFNFKKAYLKKALKYLSPGERARLSFAILTRADHTFLILDEPTNHLDIWTKEAIEQALRSFGGAVLLVSHDRYFVENVGVDKVMKLGV
ncbi:ATP-binding cassette domain-containing protein [Patescibacteria group bacterium]|nr:ATP-binding cassette domain-containing protein [Patescibacteria group bacterium]